jgi:hypothetical protein
MPRKTAVSKKRKSPEKRVELAIYLGPLAVSPAQIAQLKKSLKNQVVTFVESETPGGTVPTIICEEFRRPPIRRRR